MLSVVIGLKVAGKPVTFARTLANYSMSQKTYQSRINKVIDYIDLHLAEPLDLDTLAEVASFSRFHFHRLFRALVGESVGQYVGRLRVEKAARQLTYHGSKSITEIALDCGFSNSATFARAFKASFGMSATAFRELGEEARSKIHQANSKNRQTASNEGKAFEVSIDVFAQHHHPIWNIMSNNNIVAKVEVKDLPAITLAYVRHIGPFVNSPEVFQGLMTKIYAWAGPRGLINFPETETLSVYQDDPHVTDSDKLRLQVGISVPPDTAVEGEVGKMTLKAGKYALSKFEIDGDQYEAAWNSLYQHWLPESGYQPADAPSFERYLNDPGKHPEGKHIVEIGIPVEPAPLS